MRQEAGRQEALPGSKGSCTSAAMGGLRLWKVAMVMPVPNASPFVASASPETSVYPLCTHTQHTHIHSKLRMIQLSPHFAGG